MSKTVEALQNIQSKRNHSEPPSQNSNPVRESGFPKFGIVLWLAASISATVFSYQLGVKQGMEAVEMESPRQWLNYFSDFAPEAKPVQPSELKPPGSLPQEKAATPKVEEDSKKRGFTVQVVTYRSQKLAADEAARLKTKGHEAFVVPSGKYFQVCIDLFEDRKLALKKLVQFRSDGYHKNYPGAFVKSVSI